MKNILKTFCLMMVFIFSTNSKAQNLQIQLDTLNYVKQFEINKAQYVNKPLSFLLNQMTEIQPKTHWSDSSTKNKNAVISSRFSFCEKSNHFSHPITLLIFWENSFPKSGVKYLQNKNNFYFTNEERLFYNDKIVKDIMVYR